MYITEACCGMSFDIQHLDICNICSENVLFYLCYINTFEMFIFI